MGKGYYYFETPDYDNCAGKVWYATKYSFGISASYAFFDVVLEQKHKRTFTFVSGKFARCVVPWTSSLMLGSSVACALSNLRGKKDDCWNYFLGGCLTGLIWTPALKCSGHGAAMGFFCGLMGVYFKLSNREDWVIIPDHIEGNTAFGGAGHYTKWADIRIPGLIWEDPGRKPL